MFKRYSRVLIIVTLAIAAGLAPKGVLSVNGASSMAIDGSGNAWCSHSTNSCSTTLTTTHSNDIIIAYTTEALDLQTSCNFNVSDSSGLSWTARSSDVFSIDGRDQIQEFWAPSPSVLVSDNLTESILGCAGSYGGEYNGIVAFAVSGANFANPFDPNLSLAASAVGNGGVTSVQFSTSNSGDLAIAGSWQHGPGTASAGQGFTMINYNPAGINTAESEILSTPVTNSAASLANIPSDYWMIIADALQSGPTTPDFSLSASPGSLTLMPGTIGSSTITMTGFNGFTGTVSLSTSQPTGIGASINPVNISGSSTASLTIIANSTGTFTIQVTGTSGTLSHSVSVSVTVAGLVCIVQAGSTSCPMAPADINGGGQSQVRIAVFVQDSSGLNGFDITLLTTHTILRPAGVDLSGTVLLGTPSILSECVGGVLVHGSACSSLDTVDTLELAATSAIGQPITSSPTSGLLFTAIYNVTGSTNGTAVDFQTGCGSSTSPTSDTPYCLDIVNGSASPVLESPQGASFTTSQTLTESFNGVNFQIVNNLVNESSVGHLAGAIQVTATNATTGQAIFSKTYSVDLTYPILGQGSSMSTVRFVLLVSALKDGILCSASPSTAPLIHCFATYDPDVFNQGQINIVDAGALSLAYGSTPGSPRWNPYFDFDQSGTIGLEDVSIVFLYYGATLIA